MKWIISFYNFGDKDYLFHSSQKAVTVLRKQMTTLKAIGCHDKDIVVVSNLSKPGYFKKIQWVTKVLSAPCSTQDIHIYTVFKNLSFKRENVFIWDSHFPLICQSDIEAAVGRWDRQTLLASIERAKRHPFHLLCQTRKESQYVEFWLPRTIMGKQINGRQSLKTTYHLSGAFLLASTESGKDLLSQAILGDMQYLIVPETKAFSMLRNSVEARCIDEILRTPRFYEVMGNTFSIEGIEALYPESLPVHPGEADPAKKKVKNIQSNAFVAEVSL